jgi:hypothetical protein
MKSHSTTLLIPYLVVTFMPLSVWIGKRIGVANWIPIIMFGWGAFTIAHGFIKNEAQMIAYRLMIGVFEAGKCSSPVVVGSLSQTSIASWIVHRYSSCQYFPVVCGVVWIESSFVSELRLLRLLSQLCLLLRHDVCAVRYGSPPGHILRRLYPIRVT